MIEVLNVVDGDSINILKELHFVWRLLLFKTDPAPGILLRYPSTGTMITM